MRPLFSTLFLVSVTAALAQPSAPISESDQLTATIARLDAKMFDAFNAHDTARVMALFADDVEFYHDKDGLSHYRETAESFPRLFASAPDIRRDLIPGSLQVYPLKDYGAIEVGVHRFTHTENGKVETGTFKFVHIWHKSGDSWKVERVVSYGH